MCYLFLSEIDIHQLTGLRRPKAQCKWLRRHGWKYDVNALGLPVVAIAEAERKLVGNPIKQSAGKEPNWGNLDGQKT